MLIITRIPLITIIKSARRSQCIEKDALCTASENTHYNNMFEDTDSLHRRRASPETWKEKTVSCADAAATTLAHYRPLRETLNSSRNVSDTRRHRPEQQ